ncbi:rhomboid family intramembrane serine protease [Neorhodopirellula lusitana]|nr:rhomboid family intramembrane serine protease [Neorhodopirellula lusitana]
MIPPSLIPVAAILAAMWLVYLVDFLLPISMVSFGLVPRTFQGILGIPAMTFLHGGMKHLLGNTVPLAILLSLTIVTRDRPWPSIISIVLGGGALLWLFGRSANHVGASLLIFGLITFLITVGIREKQFVSIAIALAVGFFFGGSLLWGVIPMPGSSVSWDGHLCGAIAGVVVGLNATDYSFG